MNTYWIDHTQPEPDAPPKLRYSVTIEFDDLDEFDLQAERVQNLLDMEAKYAEEEGPGYHFYFEDLSQR